jgi:G3E family GTPase
MQSIPITVFTGFLGAGKTTTILSLLPQLPKDYKVVLLKNEFGDIEGLRQCDDFHVPFLKLSTMQWTASSRFSQVSLL